MEPSDEKQEPEPERKPGEPLKLRDPVQFGSELIEELVFKPSARAFKEFSLPMDQRGKIDYQPYALAQVGIKMAGHPAAVVDKLSVRDMNEVAQAVLGFLVG